MSIPDGETPGNSKKISLKNLYVIFKDTESHGLASVQFLSALNLFFGGDTKLSKDTITELYKNLSLETLSGAEQVQFDKIYKLTAHINFKIKHSILAYIDDQGKAVKIKNKNVKDTYECFKKPSVEDDFEHEIVEDILKDKSYETTYVEPTVQDVVTIDGQIKEIDDFLQLASEFNKVDAAATRQKKVDYYNKLFKDTQGEPDRRQKIDDAITTEYISIDDDLFSDNDQQHIIDFVDNIRSEIDTDDILFEHEPIVTTPSVPV